MIPTTFRVSPSSGGCERIDEKAGVIYGCRVIEFGDVNDDRPVTVDAETLGQVIDLGNRPNKGLKARFTHPNMSNDGLGRYLGRWRNFRLTEDGIPAVLADLHFADVAYSSPDGDLANYVLELAHEDATALGVSIAPNWDTDAMDKLQADLPDGARVPLRISRLRAADIVDEPAATRGGLFSIDFEDQRAVPAILNEILGRHYRDASPEEVLARAKDYIGRFYHLDLGSDTELQMAEEKTVEVVEEQTDFREEAQPYVAAFGDRGATWFLEGKELLDCYDTVLSELQEENDSLREQLAAALEGVGEEPLSASEEQLSEDDKKKAERQEKLAEASKRGISEAEFRWSQALAK